MKRRKSEKGTTTTNFLFKVFKVIKTPDHYIENALCIEFNTDDGFFVVVDLNCDVYTIRFSEVCNKLIWTEGENGKGIPHEPKYRRKK